MELVAKFVHKSEGIKYVPKYAAANVIKPLKIVPQSSPL